MYSYSVLVLLIPPSSEDRARFPGEWLPSSPPGPDRAFPLGQAREGRNSSARCQMSVPLLEEPGPPGAVIIVDPYAFAM